MQDVIAPNVRELKVRVTSLERQVESFEKHMDARFTAMEKQMDARFAAMQMQLDIRSDAVDTRFAACESKVDVRFAAMDQKMDAEFHAILNAISESKMQAELTNVRLLSPLSERVAILEIRHQQPAAFQ